MSVELPKTEASEASVPVIAPLRNILDAWKATGMQNCEAELADGCWIFQAGFTRKKDHPATLLDAARLTPLSRRMSSVMSSFQHWRRQRLSGVAITHSVAD